MEKSDQEFFAEKQKAFDLLDQIEKYKVDHKQEVQELKKQINNETPDIRFALCLMLEEDIKQENLDNLKTLINTPELFINIININQLKHLMYWLLYYAAYNNKDTCVNYIYQKYLNLFETPIFSGREEFNDYLLYLLVKENKLDSIHNLIEKGILDWVQNKSELKTLAQEKSLSEMENILNQKINNDRIEKYRKCRKKCCNIFVITGCLSALLFFPRLFS